MHEQVNIPDVVRRAVAQPLIVKQGDDFDNAYALHEWGMMLGERWPLWALRAEAFRRLNGLPLTYPLSACVRSICRDEGLIVQARWRGSMHWSTTGGSRL